MKAIPGYPRYLACERGYLYSSNYKNSGQTKRLKPAKDACGYLRTMLQRADGSYRTVKVHRVIALAFHGKSSGLQVNHIDGDKTNNRPSNLEYATHSENIQHAFDTGLIRPKRGSLNGMSKITEEEVRAIRQHAASNGRYYGRKMLAEKYGISEAHIKDIVSRRRDIWPHV